MNHGKYWVYIEYSVSAPVPMQQPDFANFTNLISQESKLNQRRECGQDRQITTVRFSCWKAINGALIDFQLIITTEREENKSK